VGTKQIKLNQMNESSNNSFLSGGKNGFEKTEGINVVSMFDGASCEN
jgi:hypothetical protein